jgi:methylenetetrahydrofolate reductase (NADPH)
VASRTIKDMLAGGTRLFSFEFFPPKTDDGERQLWQAIRQLEPLRPDFVSVTYGAGGSTRDRTVAMTERIASDTTLVPLAHLTAVDHSVAELRRSSGSSPTPASATCWRCAATRRAIRRATGCSTRRASSTPTSSSASSRPRATSASASPRSRRSTRALPTSTPTSPASSPSAGPAPDFAITQMFFRVDDYLRLRDRVAAAGCDVPVIPGVMPVTNLAQIERMTTLMGSEFPADFAADLRAVEDDPEAVRELGVSRATEMCDRLLAEGVPGLHFITLNRSTATREIWSRLGLHAS